MKRSSKYWFKNEKEVMRKLGLKPTISSGNKWIDKEDGKNEYILAQLKSTEKSSIAIKLVDFNQLEYNANIAHKVPLFIVQFVDGPILLCLKPEDLKDVCDYLVLDKKNKREIVEVEENENVKNESVVKSSKKREKVKDKMRKEREKLYSDRRKRK